MLNIVSLCPSTDKVDHIQTPQLWFIAGTDTPAFDRMIEAGAIPDQERFAIIRNDEVETWIKKDGAWINEAEIKIGEWQDEVSYLNGYALGGETPLQLKDRFMRFDRAQKANFIRLASGNPKRLNVAVLVLFNWVNK